MAEGKRRGGGPKTPEGKANSRENSTKHGARAKHVHLAVDETPEQYDEHSQSWHEQLYPESFLEERLVEQMVMNHWLMLRANRRNLAVDAPESDPHQIELMQRYKTTAERAFYRSWGAVRQLKNDFLKFQVRIQQLVEKSEEKDSRQAETEKKLSEAEKKIRQYEEKDRSGPQGQRDSKEAAMAGRAKKKAEKLQVIEQWAEIRKAEDGTTSTELLPSNEQIQKEASKLERAPDLVYRRLHFVGRVPMEYAWATADERTAAAGGMGTQRLTWARWQEQIVREALSPGGHLQPCGGNLPRPMERGGCECEVCVENGWMLGAAGLE